MSVRTLENRVVSYTGTVHYAENGRPACSTHVQTANSWLTSTRATVTCKRCIAEFGADEPGHEVETVAYFPDEHAERRAAERAARRTGRRT